MNIVSKQITYQEVPGEISLSYLVAGCPIGCKDCNSKDTWYKNAGKPYSRDDFKQDFKTHKGLATCICFMGGEWHKEELINILKLARSLGYKTCLYSGREGLYSFDRLILRELDYLKTGRYIKHRELNKKNTNQRFWHFSGKKTYDLTDLFTKKWMQEKEQE